MQCSVHPKFIMNIERIQKPRQLKRLHSNTSHEPPPTTASEVAFGSGGALELKLGPPSDVSCHVEHEYGNEFARFSLRSSNQGKGVKNPRWSNVKLNGSYEESRLKTLGI